MTHSSLQTGLQASFPDHGGEGMRDSGASCFCSRCDYCRQPPVCHCQGQARPPEIQAECFTITRPPFGSRSFRPIDHKALSYFYIFAAVDLSGYLPGRFWDRLALQISDTEPLVQQALVALSLAHLDYCTTDSASATSLAAQQSATVKLRQYMRDEADPSREVVSLCFMLFFAFSRITQDAICS